MDRQRLKYYLIATAFVLIYLWAAERQLHLSALPDGFDPTTLVYPVTVNGNVAGSVDELRALALGADNADAIVVVEGGRQRVFAAQPALSSFYLIITALNGLFFWAVSVLVFAARMDRGPARDLYWACLLYGLAVSVGAIFMPRAGASTDMLLGLGRILALVLLPALLFSVSMTFPYRRPVLDRRPWLMPGVFWLAMLVAVAQSVAYLLYARAPSPALWSVFKVANLGGKLFLAVVFALGCGLFAQSLRRAVSAREIEQTKWILWGITCGGAPYIFLHGLPRAFGAEQLVLPIEIARLCSIVIPLAFSVTVIRYKFLDIDVIIRRSLIYPLLASVMVGIYLLLGVAIGREFELRFPGSSPYIPIVATVVPVSLFVPTRRLIAFWVDRTFFKIGYDYGRSLEEFARRISHVNSQDQLADLLLKFLQEKLDPMNSGIAYRVRGEYRTQGTFSVSTLQSFSRLKQFLHVDGSATAVPNSTSSSDLESADLPRELVNDGLTLVQPMLVNNKLMGLVLVGEKRSERRYIEQDLGLLRQFAQLTAAAIERMNLVQTVAEEAVARTRSDEMNRFRTQFFSQVAHDLRSPLTSISWAAHNLLDGVVGPINEKQKVYLNGIMSSSDQLKRLVNNLLETTRMEASTAKVELGPTKVSEVVRNCLQKIAPVAHSNRVTFDVDLPEDLPAVTGDAEKLLDVLDNLFENAVRYSPPNTAVQIKLETEDHDRQCLTVRDVGPGLPVTELDALFEPYKQGPPSPYSPQMGFGLGLNVVKTYMELMHGTVRATNHADGGAVFTCIFAPWDPSLTQASATVDETKEKE